MEPNNRHANCVLHCQFCCVAAGSHQQRHCNGRGWLSMPVSILGSWHSAAWEWEEPSCGLECMQKVFRSNYDLAAGKPWDTFHIFKPMTHCAAIDKLKTKFNASHGWTDFVLSLVGGSKQGQKKTRGKVQNETHQRKVAKETQTSTKKTLALLFQSPGWV